ncbi:DUF6978 family protein [Allofustis seminis]|uniref:DUF6978 family protein n=1 Tax=Allofustis seminis TaxID=166939 RepID=UPI00037A0620|nr:hypothetical protein [Allofustis seminis]
MKSLAINDQQAEELIKLVKSLEKKIDKTFTSHKETGEIKILGNNGYPFILNYFFSDYRKTINFREAKNNINLIRVNIDNNFHKNSNQEKVAGLRINIFSEEEYFNKADGATYMKAHSLPYANIYSINNFILLLKEVLKFLNTEYNGLLNINIQTDLLV